VHVTVVIATYDRSALARRLLEQLDAQTLDPSRYEVIVVDDGSKTDVRRALADVRPRYALRIERQANAGPAAARQRGVELARGEIVVFLDDDMSVLPDFLERHLAYHGGEPTVVLGKLRPRDALESLPLFERFYARTMAREADDRASGKVRARGHDLYTGNVSMPRSLFFAAGGFDFSLRQLEDLELGIRLEEQRARFVMSTEAFSVHESDKTSLRKWLRRSFLDGVYATRVARKHPNADGSNPFRFLPELHPVKRVLAALSVGMPATSGALALAIAGAARAMDAIGLEPVALAGTTLAYGVQYYRGVRVEAGSLRAVVRQYRAYLRDAPGLTGGSPTAPRRAESRP
jgi:glycosyltransferase involved in cell wall biosynthesis